MTSGGSFITNALGFGNEIPRVGTHSLSVGSDCGTSRSPPPPPHFGILTASDLASINYSPQLLEYLMNRSLKSKDCS